MSTKITKKEKFQLSNWKNKAQERGRELRAMKKRMKELEGSRNFYKKKWKAEAEKCISYARALKASERVSVSVKNHSYDLQTIFLCLALKMSGVGCSECRAFSKKLPPLFEQLFFIEKNNFSCKVLAFILFCLQYKEPSYCKYVGEFWFS